MTVSRLLKSPSVQPLKKRALCDLRHGKNPCPGVQSGWNDRETEKAADLESENSRERGSV
jgi:hypothetical protein